jgi:tetratricopeptide (TPR) repeat protein
MCSREVDGVLITPVFTEKGSKAAAVCLETAADAVHYYREWLGFYPFPFLTIIPSQASRMGGYPVGTGIVAIHGLETYADGEPPLHWQHITSHEIGHQYWGEWVLDADNPGWLWIAMGIFADSEFMTVRGFDPNRRAAWMENYVKSIPMYYDTTLDILPLLIFEKTSRLEIKDARFWFKLGMLLYDSGYYGESLTAFGKIESLAQRGVIAFAAMVWRGQLNDLLGNREKALACYRNALKLDTGDSVQHSQYQMVIDRNWVESRLKTPFTRQKP